MKRLLLSGVVLAVLNCAAGVDPVLAAENVLQIDGPSIDVKLERTFPNVEIPRPIFLTDAADGTQRLFIGSQYGEIYVLPSSDHEAEAELFLDIRDRVVYDDKQNEEGLLGLAFHPKFEENGEFFVYYTTKDEPQMSHISRFRVSADDPNKADPNSEELLMKIKQPFWNHNGGTLAFGPDGYLYIGLGDGGKANDPLLSAQDLTTVLGKLLRIDVDGRDEPLAYAIPDDNPFVDVEGARPEIYAYGFRNIWRLSFDAETGDLYVADVGQNLWEEINVVTKGGNYGWSVKEATHPFHGERGNLNDAAPMTDPIWEYPHEDTVGKSITGGLVYRGSAIPELRGYYIYGDYVTGRLWALKYDKESGKAIDNRVINWPPHLPIVSFGTDAAGELYMTSTVGDGQIYRFVPAK